MTIKTITMTDRPPVRIDTEKWELIASVKDWDNQHECQANRTWKMFVREHEDGRRLVYAVYTTQFQSDSARRGGELVPADGDLISAIHRVADDTCMSEGLAQRLIADLPAEDI